MDVPVTILFDSSGNMCTCMHECICTGGACRRLDHLFEPHIVGHGSDGVNDCTGAIKANVIVAGAAVCKASVKGRVGIISVFAVHPTDRWVWVVRGRTRNGGTDEVDADADNVKEDEG